MLFYLFLLFTLVPVAELALLIWIGSKTSVAFTVALVLLTGIVGATLARWQGWRTYLRIQDELAAGRMPGEAMVDGVLILIAGLLLVTPGVLTDAVGFALLIPPARRLMKRGTIAWIRRNFRVETVAFTSGAGGGATHASANGDHIVEARVLETRVEDVP